MSTAKIVLGEEAIFKCLRYGLGMRQKPLNEYMAEKKKKAKAWLWLQGSEKDSCDYKLSYFPLNHPLFCGTGESVCKHSFSSICKAP